MKLICLEGIHGVGKTTLCEKYKQQGFEVLDEAFFDRRQINEFDVTSYMNEVQVMTEWFSKVYHKLSELYLRLDGAEYLVVDRSPLACFAYFGVQSSNFRYNEVISKEQRHLLTMMIYGFQELQGLYPELEVIILNCLCSSPTSLLTSIRNRYEEKDGDKRKALREDDVSRIRRVSFCLDSGFKTLLRQIRLGGILRFSIVPYIILSEYERFSIDLAEIEQIADSNQLFLE